MDLLIWQHSKKSLKKKDRDFIQALTNLTLSIYDFDICLGQEQNQSKVVYIVKHSLYIWWYTAPYMWNYFNNHGILLWDWKDVHISPSCHVFLINVILSNIKHFSTLLSGNIFFFSFVNLILLLFLLWPVFPFTSQATTYPLSLPGLDSVQDLILCPIVSLWHIHTHFIKGHLCWWVLKSYFPPPFWMTLLSGQLLTFISLWCLCSMPSLTSP